MADGRKFRKSGMQGGPELLQCIPNQIIIQNIAPKVWASLIQRAFRRWRSRHRSPPATTSTGMADGREFQMSDMQSKQELLPCIPNHITIQNIAPKITWEALNVMQMVNREWRFAVRSRSVYDARVLSKSTEAFLVLISFEQRKKLTLTLYSCKSGICLQLPLIPMAMDMIFHLECICFDGKVYLWVFENNSKQAFRGFMEIWALDLAGDRQWAKNIRVNVDIDTCPFEFSNGVLDGKLYRFGGNNRPFDISVLEAQDTDVRQRKKEKPIGLKVKFLPQTEIYDLRSNIFSVKTPEPLPHAVVIAASKADLKKHFASFCDWEREQLRTGFLAITGYYEPFYSEWRALLSTTSAAGGNDYYPRDAMAPQVYHSTYQGNERFFFIQEKLVKLVDPGLKHIRQLVVKLANPGLEHSRLEGVGHTDGGPGETVDLQVYNIQRGVWEHWQSFSDPCGGCDRSTESAVLNGAPILSCVFADNVIWILVTVCPTPYLEDSAKFSLLKSLPFLHNEAEGHSGAWIDLSCSINHLLTKFSVLRPIYI